MGLQDDIAYVSILLASIAFGKVFRMIPPELSSDGKRTFNARRYVSTVAGLVICYLVSGVHTIHLILQILGNIIILKCVPVKKCHILSFIWCFSYLTLFRLSARLGLPEPPPHTNAIILILTLKMVGLAFEVHDSLGEADAQNGDLLDPSVSDVFHYSLGHIGLITGPYYKYQTWRGLYNDSWNPAVSGAEGCESSALKRAKNVPFYVVMFLASGYLFPLGVVQTPEWKENHGLLYKLFYMMPVFFNFRMRIYAGFTLSECACIMAGLGAYPQCSQPRPGQGPTRPEKLESAKDEELKLINFETVHNIDEWGSDFVPSMREALRCWNMTVQHWLVFTVYKRFPIKSLRTAMVMLVSSIWHGVHPGYYLSLGSVPLCLMVEDYYRRIVRNKLSEEGQRFYDWVGWFVRMRWFDYLGMGFLLLNIDTTMDYWSSVYYAGHVSLVIFGVLGMILVNPLMKIIIKQDLKEE